MLKTSSDPFTILYSERLMPESLDVIEKLQRKVERFGDQKSINLTLNNLPIVQLGCCEIMPLERLVPKNKKLKNFIGDLDHYNYYIIQFPINFRSDNLVIHDAKFLANIECEGNGSIKVVDLYPKEQIEILKKNVSIGIAPNIKFAEISAQVFDISYSFAYDEIQPVVYGGGVGLSHLYWTLRESIGYSINGVKIFHALIKVTKNAKSLSVNSEIQAALRIGGRLGDFINTLLGENDTTGHRRLMSFDLESCLPI